MTIQEKAEALHALGGLQIRLRDTGDWYVSFDRNVCIGGDGMLTSPTDSSPTPDRAIERMWDRLTCLEKPELYVAVDTLGDGARRHYRWAGFMWREIPR